MLSPIVTCIRDLERLGTQENTASLIEQGFGGVEAARVHILRDFFRHGFDGSGDDGRSLVCDPVWVQASCAHFHCVACRWELRGRPADVCMELVPAAGPQGFPSYLHADGLCGLRWNLVGSGRGEAGYANINQNSSKA